MSINAYNCFIFSLLAIVIASSFTFYLGYISISFVRVVPSMFKSLFRSDLPSSSVEIIPLPYVHLPSMDVVDLTNLRSNLSNNSTAVSVPMLPATLSEDDKYRFTFWNYPFIRNFSMLLDHPDMCLKRSVSMVVGILSAPGMFAERRIARSAPWFSGTATFPVLSLFLLGRTDNPSQQEEIAKENLHFGDIIQQNFTDAYRNLTYKVLMGMEWTAAHCPQAFWFMRLNIAHYAIKVSVIEDYTRRHLANESSAAELEHDFVCPLVREGKLPMRNFTRWIATIDEYPESVYPPYCEGTSFMTPVKATSDILRVSAKTRFFWLEDVYITGIVRELIGTMHLRSLSYENWIT